MRIDFEVKGIIVIGLIHGKDPEKFDESKFLGMKFPKCILQKGTNSNENRQFFRSKKIKNSRKTSVSLIVNRKTGRFTYILNNRTSSLGINVDKIKK